MEVGEVDLVDLDQPQRALHLALRPLAAVEHQPLAAARDQHARGRAPRRGHRAARAEKGRPRDPWPASLRGVALHEGLSLSGMLSTSFLAECRSMRPRSPSRGSDRGSTRLVVTRVRSSSSLSSSSSAPTDLRSPASCSQEMPIVGELIGVSQRRAESLDRRLGTRSDRRRFPSPSRPCTRPDPDLRLPAPWRAFAIAPRARQTSSSGL